MKKIYLLIFVILLALPTIAQRKCATMDSYEAQLQKDPALQTRMQKIENHAKAYEQSGAVMQKAGTIVNIPVVVHVLYNTSSQNITDAQIQSQLTVLNKDFRKLNTDASLVPSTFSALAADAEITFCLATIDPNGAATTGITRTSTTKTIFDAEIDDAKYSSQGGKDAWNSSKYLNLWIVPEIKSGTDMGILGYAQFPGGAAATDGVVIDNNYFGTTGTVTAPFNKGRTATHEVGHWLNLRHIWGDASCGSDLVNDTPTHQTKNFGCPSHPKTNSCGTSAEMFMNYMDYTDDACMYMFSLGQKTRMQALFATGGFRNAITTSTACGGIVTPPTVNYCTANGTNVTYEYIKNVTLNTINNTTSANGGYGNFTSLSTTVNKGTAYTLSLTPGFVGSSYSEYFKVYIDYNNDLDFDDVGESVYTSAATTSAVSTAITIPLTAATATVRMRVIMKDGAISGPCEVYTYGEVEDYTINIQAAVPTCGNASGLSVSSITASGATLNWTAVSGAASYNIRYKATSSSTWLTATATSNSKAITGLTASTAYEFQVQTVCSGASAVFTASVNFNTIAATTTCATPGSLTNTNVTSTGSALSWSNTSASSYTYRYRKIGTTTWTTVANGTATSAVIYQLTASTNYEWQVMATCSGVNGAYSASKTFTTLSSSTCGTDIYEANETLSAAKSISTGTTIKSLICGSTDVDWYKISNTSTYPNIKVTLSTLAADYDLYLYNSSGTLLYKSENGSSTDEKVIYNAAPVGTYYIKVSGYNGANNTSTYYSLLPTRSSTAYASRLANEDEELLVPKEGSLSTTNLLKDMMVYPNPSVDNVINVAIPSSVNTETKITLFDAMGRIVKTVEVGPTSVNTINTDEFSTGIYILKAETYNGIELRKIQIIK